MVKFKPLHDHILVRPVERKQSDTLWTPIEKFNRGTVVAVGPGERLKKKNGAESGTIRPIGVKVGDFITYGDLDWIFPKYIEDGIEYRILQDKDVTFIVDQEEKRDAA